MSIDNSKLLIQDLSKLFNNSNNYDVKIIVGKGDNIEEFNAHSIILKVRSNYFNIILNKWTKKNDTIPNINISNIDPHVFKIILNWIQDNFMQVYNVAFKCVGLEFIQKYCEELISKNVELVLGSHNFNLIDRSLLISIIKKDELALGEIEIWDYVIKWGMKQKPQINSEISELTHDDYEKLQIRLHGILEHIRFFTISKDDFWNKIWPLKNLLSDNLINNLVNYNLPSRIPPPIGSLSKRIPKKLNDSNIINYRQANIIANWIDRNDDKFEHKLGTTYNYELLLRGSRDGMDMNSFESICSEQSNTLVIIKLRGSDKIIGGYNPRYWGYYDDDYYLDVDDIIVDFDHEDNDEDDDDDDDNDDDDDDDNDDDDDDNDDDDRIDDGDDGERAGFIYDDYDDDDLWLNWLYSSNSFIFSFDNHKMDSYILSRVKNVNRAIVFDWKIGFGDLQFFPDGNYNHCYYKKKIIDTDSFVIEDYEVFSVF
ncbi:hypothetical protein RclHR1_01480009 [Rhizophagus clarus]|uniref:BTB domain-containing protein n=1 Tax=Rhizophagus clarus TaxID=94130 RepID=A0A2Z6QSV5_9GLOM|nr:hypothetical protein RclHR1_01480009 [Rhizophagus clarus]